MTGLEAAFAALVLAAIGRWLKRIAVHVMLPWKKWGHAPDPAGVRQESEFWRGEVNTLVNWLQSHAVSGQRVSTTSEVRRHLDSVRNLLVRIPDEVFEDIRRELVQGYNQGDATKTIAEKIQGILDVSGPENWPNRAQVIAVTEVNGALNAGWFGGAVAQQAQFGQPLAKKWIATHDSHTRADHRQADGQIVPLLSPFIVGESPLLYPGDKAGPPEQVINCVAEGSLIQAPSLRAIARFQWDGPVFTLTGQRGFRATVSPYHPVLTERGWIPACEVQEGDHLFCAVQDLFGTAGTPPHIQAAPAHVEQVFDTMALSGNAQRVRGLGVDFHGDRPHGEVDVVLAGGPLVLGEDAPLPQLLQQLLLALANRPGASQSPSFQLSIRPPNAPSGIVSSLDLGGTSLGGHAFPLEKLGFVTSPGLDTHFLESASNTATGNGEMLGEAFDRLAAHVSFEKIVHVEIATYHGYLYSPETESGIYISDGIISHNCRCTAAVVGSDD
jgi:hypothetical protein